MREGILSVFASALLKKMMAAWVLEAQLPGNNQLRLVPASVTLLARCGKSGKL